MLLYTKQCPCCYWRTNVYIIAIQELMTMLLYTKQCPCCYVYKNVLLCCDTTNDHARIEEQTNTNVQIHELIYYVKKKSPANFFSIFQLGEISHTSFFKLNETMVSNSHYNIKISRLYTAKRTFNNVNLISFCLFAKYGLICVGYLKCVATKI